MTSLNITLSMNDAFQSGFVPILKKCRVASSSFTDILSNTQQAFQVSIST
jgi:hypothetical protein